MLEPGKIAATALKEPRSDSTRTQKWDRLSSFLTHHGREALAYATLQDGMEYFVHETGYIAYTAVRHPVFARKGKRIALSDPVCAPEHYATIVRSFIAECPAV